MGKHIHSKFKTNQNNFITSFNFDMANCILYIAFYETHNDVCDVLVVNLEAIVK